MGRIAGVGRARRACRLLLLGLDLKGCAFDDFEEGLLYAFTSDVFAVADSGGGDLVHFIEADDASFGSCNVIVCGCQQPLDANLSIFTYVARLSERRAIRHAERDR